MYPCVCCLFIDGRCLVGWGGMDEDEDAGDSAKALHWETISHLCLFMIPCQGQGSLKWKASK